MSRIIKVNFHVSTGIVGSDRSEVVEIEVDEDFTEDEINEAIEEEYNDWMYNKLDTCWTIID